MPYNKCNIFMFSSGFLHKLKRSISCWFFSKVYFLYVLYFNVYFCMPFIFYFTDRAISKTALADWVTLDTYILNK